MSKHICIVSPGLKLGGIERASTNVANSLIDKGYEVTFLALFKNKAFFELHRKVRYIEPEGFNISKLNLCKSIKYLRRNLINIKPDSILVYNKFYAAITSLSIIGTKMSYFLSERSSPLYQWGIIVGIFNKLSFTINPPKGVMAQTSIAANYQRKYYPKKTFIKVVPNTLREIKKFPNLVKKEQIIAVGRVNDQLKGFDLLIDAYALVNNPWPLKIVGVAKGAESIKEKIESYALSDKIALLPPSNEIDRHFAESEIFVIPSRSEGFPNALCEAMAAGLACVSFDFIAGPRDLIENGVNGMIVTNGDIKGLASAIQALQLDDITRKNLAYNATEIKDRLSPQKIIPQMINFIFKES